MVQLSGPQGIPIADSSSYYIPIKHRNSVETTTSLPVAFNANHITYFFDAVNKAYGGNLKESTGGTKAIYAGNANLDGLVDATDMITVANHVAAFSSGYLPEDINGDGLVDATDMMVVENNVSEFVSVILP